MCKSQLKQMGMRVTGRMDPMDHQPRTGWRCGPPSSPAWPWSAGSPPCGTRSWRSQGVLTGPREQDHHTCPGGVVGGGKHKRLAFGSKQPQELCVRVCASARPVKCGRGRRRLPLELHTYRTRIRSNRTRRACSVPEASPMRWICTAQHTITGARTRMSIGVTSARTKVSVGTVASSRARKRLQATPHITPTCSLRSSASPSSSLSE